MQKFVNRWIIYSFKIIGELLCSLLVWMTSRQLNIDINSLAELLVPHLPKLGWIFSKPVPNDSIGMYLLMDEQTDESKEQEVMGVGIWEF